jgi:hypothetical protein
MLFRQALIPSLIFGLAACNEPSPNVATSPSGEKPMPVETVTPPPAPSGPFAATPEPGVELPTSQTTPGPIPLAFRHVWAIAPEDCNAEPGLTRIAIAPGAIRFYEGRSVVISANTSLEGTVALKVSHASEGTRTEEAHTLALNPGKDMLTYDRNGEAFTYKRCD